MALGITSPAGALTREGPTPDDRFESGSAMLVTGLAAQR